MVLTLVIGASIATVAVVAAIPGLQPTPPELGRDESFVRPFDYQVPSGSNITLDVHSDSLHVLVVPPGNVQGISIWAVGDVLVDHCSWEPTSPLAGREHGVEGLLAYLRSVDRLDVNEIGPVVIDGKPGYRVDLSVEGGDSGCPGDGSIFLWPDKSAHGYEDLIQVPEEGHVPLTLVDVDGETIAIEIWSGDDVDAWLPVAQQIVDSIRFLYRPPVESHPASPGGAPG